MDEFIQKGELYLKKILLTGDQKGTQEVVIGASIEKQKRHVHFQKIESHQVFLFIYISLKKKIKKRMNQIFN